MRDGRERTTAGARTRAEMEAAFDAVGTRTFGERLADRIAAFGGSWRFILLFFGFLIAWTGLNTFVLARGHRAFDAYPYIFLNLMLSMLAAMQAPVIMMSQHRQTERDRVATQMDADVNLKAEREICSLHEKLDALREAQWAELVRTQQVQIGLLEQLLGAPARGGRPVPNGTGAPNAPSAPGAAAERPGNSRAGRG